MTVTRTEYINYLRSLEGYYGAGAGHAENDTPFNTWYYGHRVSGLAYAWCAVLECYAENHFGILLKNGGKVAYVPNMPAVARNCGAEVWNKPRHGSAAYTAGNKVGYDFNRSGEAEHTGTFWKGRDSETFWSIDGNTGNDQVAARIRNYSDVLFVVETLGIGPTDQQPPHIPDPVEELEMNIDHIPPRAERWETYLSFPKGKPTAIGFVYDNTASDNTHPQVEPARLSVRKGYAGENEGETVHVVIGETLGDGKGWPHKQVISLTDAPSGKEYDRVFIYREDDGNRNIGLDWS